jgi:hypothetical protein
LFIHLLKILFVQRYHTLLDALGKLKTVIGYLLARISIGSCKLHDMNLKVTAVAEYGIKATALSKETRCDDIEQ